MSARVPPASPPLARLGAPGFALLAATGLLVTTGLGGCGLVGGPDREATEYLEQMAPVLEGNMALTREFVDVATEVKQGKATPKDIARRFEEKLVPQATQLRDAVADIKPEDEVLAATHDGLAKAWTGRVEVYAELHRAWATGDLDAFDAATRRNMKLKGSEERYLIQVNNWLAPHGLTLDMYP